MAIEIPVGSANVGEPLLPSITSADMGNSAEFTGIAWRFYANVRNLTLDNLSISYEFLPDGNLSSTRDLSSKVNVDVITRNIIRFNFGRFTIFDGYLDFSFDLTDAIRSGSYSGSLIITVECNP